MISVNDNRSLLRLFYDVHNILCEGSKEFDYVSFCFEFDSKGKNVKRVRFQFFSRKKYYKEVYPYTVELFRHLDLMSRSASSKFTFARHSVDVFYENGEKKYIVFLWY